MTPFPAWFDFHKDPVIRRHPAAQALYAELVIRPGAFFKPIPVKSWAFAQAMSTPDHPVGRATITRMLALLIERGYLDEHERDTSADPRRVTVALSRRVFPASTTQSPAQELSARD